MIINDIRNLLENTIKARWNSLSTPKKAAIAALGFPAVTLAGHTYAEQKSKKENEKSKNVISSIYNNIKNKL